MAARVGDLVLVKWLDARSCDGWHDDGELSDESLARLAACETVGWLKAKTKAAICVVQTLAADEDGKFASFTGHMNIPTKTIQSIKVLRKGKRHGR